MEVIQGKILKRIIGLPRSTPYWGLLFELNVMPVKCSILYSKAMLFHRIINSGDDRIINQLIREQEKEYGECWFTELKEDGRKMV